LQRDATLDVIARRHAGFMASTGRFAHAGAGGTDAAARVALGGFPGRFVGEALAQNTADARSTVEAWVSSPGHCRTLAAGEARAIGVAFVAKPVAPRVSATFAVVVLGVLGHATH